VERPAGRSVVPWVADNANLHQRRKIHRRAILVPVPARDHLARLGGRDSDVQIVRKEPVGKDDLTPRQQMLAASIRELLTAERVKFEDRLQLNGEAVYIFEIATSSQRALHVEIMVVDDGFQFQANGALLMRDLSAWPAGHDVEWVDECIWVLKLLLRNDLRIRECRTIFGGATRAIWLATSKNEGGWNGELPAVRRRDCPEQVFPNWYQKSEMP
jgi:hypothetical protein